MLGSALLAAEESFAHKFHKQRLVAASGRDTVLTDIFHINWPAGAKVRVLKSAVTEGGIASQAQSERKVIGHEGDRPIYLFSTDSPLRVTTGELESMALYAGTGIQHVGSVRSAAAIIADLVASADALLIEDTEDDDSPESSSAVCYAGEMSGAYMGHLEVHEAAAEAARLVADLRSVLAGTPTSDGAPPFEGIDIDLARWALALAPHASSVPYAGPTKSAAERRAELARRIAGLVGRLPGGRLQSLLSRLLIALQSSPEPARTV